jgi:hypothetical protein
MNARWIGRVSARSLVIAICVIFCAMAGWEVMFHGSNDTKDLRYQGWKLGIFPFDLDQATSTMILDAHRDELVLGKTRADLATRFGYVTSLAEASDYIKYCYNNSDYLGKQVLFLRRSNWQVVMNDDHAVDLVLVKGC